MTLAPPDLNLRVSVVVPARNEEAMIQACLFSLADQLDVSPDAYEVILVLDDCTDETEARAREVLDSHPALRLYFLGGPGKGAGQARHVGMEAACARLLELGKPWGLIASTDADTVVDPDWLAAQIELADRGSQAIGGRIKLEDAASLTKNVADWHSDQGKSRYEDLLATGTGRDSQTEHWQFSGASMSLTAEVYRRIGGLEPRTALEDENLERTLLQAGITIDRPLSVRVRTSARLVGRANRGLARDLALASWIENNTYRNSSYATSDPAGRRDTTVSIVVPIIDAVPKIEAFLSDVGQLIEDGAADEAILVSNNQEVPEISGISHFSKAELMPDFGPLRGRGDALWRGLSAAAGKIVVFLDSALGGLVSQRFFRLLGPLIEREELEMVKGFSSAPDELTELVARPFINLHLPQLAGFVDPLYPEFAARRPLLEQMLFPVGRGADVSTLLDAAQIAGLEALAQVELKVSEPARIAGGAEAYALLAAATSRLSDSGLREDPIPGPLLTPGDGGVEVNRVPVEERPPLKSVRRLSSHH